MEKKSDVSQIVQQYVWRNQSVSETSPITVQAEWESLFKSMNYWIDYAKVQGMSQRLISLVQDASYFAYRFKSFFDGIPAEVYERDETTRWAALHNARIRLTVEWDTIQRALEQRDLDRYSGQLAVLDQVAAECLEPTLGQAAAANVITYFHKVYDITRFAFSQAPLIGAPYSALHLPESWLAIPHECGHYIFWNSAKDTSDFSRFQNALEHAVVGQLVTLQTEIADNYNFFRRPREVYNMWLSWLEELFADVYSTLMVGPASGWGMQASLRTRTDFHTLNENDGEHPVPYLRPFIHIEVLRHMAALTNGTFANDLLNAATQQENVWRSSWPLDVINKLQSPDGRGRIDLMIENDLPRIVKAIFDTPFQSPDGTQETLATRYQNNKFYTEARHTRIVHAAQQLVAGEIVELVSKLETSAAVQLAISTGQGLEQIRRNLGFVAELYVPSAENTSDINLKELDAKFDDYMAGITGSTDPQEWHEDWRLVMESNLSDTGTVHQDGHHHPHSH